jgi:mitogen-activated protein kinase kinase kinase ANP1
LQALDLKKLQTPLYEEFYNTVNSGSSQGQGADQTTKGKFTNSPKLPPRGKSPPSKMRGGVSPTCDNLNNTSPVSCSKQFPSSSVESSRILREIASPQLNEFGDKSHLDAPDSPRFAYYAIFWNVNYFLQKSIHFTNDKSLVGSKLINCQYVI